MEKSALLNHEIVMASSDKSTNYFIKKMKKEGCIVKIAPKIYTTTLNDTPENIIRRNLFFILGKLYPSALLSHRSAFECRPTDDGHIYLTYNYTKKVSLPGIVIHLLDGEPAMPFDYPFVGGVHISCSARAYLENMQTGYRRDGVSKCLSLNEIEEKLGKIMHINGRQALEKLRDTAREISVTLHMEEEFVKLDTIIQSILASKPYKNYTSSVMKIDTKGEPFDGKRLKQYSILMSALNEREYEDYPEPNKTDASFRQFAFFDSYYSCCFEGVELDMTEAQEVIEDRVAIPNKLNDSEALLGTYLLASDRKEMMVTPDTPELFLELLQRRHRIIMQNRSDVLPGVFKTQNNDSGENRVVDYQQVRGTLLKGFEFYSVLRHPFSRAVFLLYMISDVQPFIEGNGRLARIMMNAELTSGGQSRIIFPTSLRSEYFSALRQLARYENPEKLIGVIQQMRQYSFHLRGESFEEMKEKLSFGGE